MNKLVFDKSIIIDNIREFKMNTKHLLNLKLILPVKVCTNVEILELFNREGFGFDISNRNELTIVRKFKGLKSIVGPKCKELILDDSNFIVYYDQIQDYIESNITDNNKGLRVNFNSSKLLDFSHFGTDFDTIGNPILKQIHNIHFHFGDVKTPEYFKFISRKIYDILNKCENLTTIDIGGGYEDVDKKSLLDFLNNIHSKLKNKQFLVLECGDFWFKNSGKLYTSVLGVKEISQNLKAVYVSTSKDCSLKWSAPEYIDHCNKKISKLTKYYFYGPSCYEKDLICVAESNNSILSGDILTFGNISHYSVEWNTGFNGIDKAEVYYE